MIDYDRRDNDNENYDSDYDDNDKDNDKYMIMKYNDYENNIDNYN